MKYKLLVLDVDGTLLNDEREISKRTLAALLKVQQMGVRIVLASGRPTYGLMPLAKTLELGNYGGFVLSYNGCQIIKAQNGEILFERRINPEMLPYLEKKARKNGFAIFTYHDDTLITDSPDNEYIKNEALLNNLKIIREDEFSTAIDFAYNPQNEMFRLLRTKSSFSQNEKFFFSHPYPALFRLISHLIIQ